VAFDEDWIQNDCHWGCNRYFEFTWKISHGDIYSNASDTAALDSGEQLDKVEFYYCLGEYKSESSALTSYYTRISINDILINTKTEPHSESNGQRWFYRKVNSYSSQLYFSSLSASQVATLYNSGCITTYVKATDKNGKIYTNYYTLPYTLVAPPTVSGEVHVKKISSKKFMCSWPRAEGIFENSPVAGYCFELEHQPAGASSYTKVKDLALDTDENGNYRIIKSVSDISIEAPEVLEGEEPIISYIGEGTSREVYLPSIDTTTVYFNPQEFNIDIKEDLIRVNIYPYIIYSNYWTYDNDGNKVSIEPSALLSGAPIQSVLVDTTAGLIRAKVSTGWIEGQVLVKTADGWKEATVIYTKTADGWKETI
jgi:hypothetical protein